MRHRLLFLSGVALCVLGSAMAVVVGLSDATAQPEKGFAGPRMPADLRAHDFALNDQRGARFAMSGQRGRVVVMTFIHSKCGSTCPVSLQTIRGALDNLGAERRDVEVLAVSVDPEADTRRSVRRFLAIQHVDDFVRYLTGPRQVLGPIWKKYGIQPQGPGSEDHTAFVLLVDRKGFLRIGFPSHQMTPEDLENDLRLLLAERAPA